jgi:hypothetical protein
MPWADPTFHFSGATGGGLLGVGGLPWWAQPPPSAVSVAHQRAMQTPPETALGGSFDYGPGGQRPDVGNDYAWSGQPGGNLPGGTQVSAETMGRLLGLVSGVPSQLTTPMFHWYGSHNTDTDPSYSSAPSDDPYATELRARAGDQWMNNWTGEGAGFWGNLHPGQGLGGQGGALGGSGSGYRGTVGGGGGADPYAGTWNPWAWGGANLY